VDLSKHFSSKEFFTADTYIKIKEYHDPKWHISELLVTRLELIRQFFNQPVHIISGYRTEKENISAGGSKNSFHKEGKAADIVIEGVSPTDVQDFVKKSFNDGGLGKGKTFTHLDVRNSDKLVEWDYA
jgi:uncharacterized protein YcbK (DUF882 family)